MYSYQTEISCISNTQHSSVFFHYGCIYIIVISILCGIGYTIYTKIIQLLKDLNEKYEVKLKNNVNDFNIKIDKMEIKYQDYIQKLERQINDMKDIVVTQQELDEVAYECGKSKLCQDSIYTTYESEQMHSNDVSRGIIRINKKFYLYSTHKTSQIEGKRLSGILYDLIPRLSFTDGYYRYYSCGRIIDTPQEIIWH